MNGLSRWLRVPALVGATVVCSIAAVACAGPSEDLKARPDVRAKEAELLEQKPLPRQTAQSALAPVKQSKGTDSRLPFGYGFQFLEFPGQ